jgi:hypothetical protein
MANVIVTPSLLSGYNTTKYTQPTLASATPVAWTTGNSPVTLFTVTGTVRCRVYGVVGATQFTSTGSTGTLAVGVAGNTAVFIAATTANGSTNFVANAEWMDTAPTVTAKLEAQATWVICTGNIILTVATNSMTAGAVVMYCDWVPVTAGASVV